ncbi:retrovirus-related pol polyprotein from transposon TNT 1-94 [Tanacetum coccineum]
MTTLAEFMIIAGADNHPPMLEKSMYDSWKSRMKLYIENKENGRIILNFVLNGPLVWPTIVEENGTSRTKKYEELLVAKKLQADSDLKATNIVLQGLPPDVYAIVNHHKVSKEIWDRVKLLMQGIKLSLQEKEFKLYDEFDKFSFVKGETLLAVPMFSQGDDHIACLNKAMAFLSAVAASRFPSTNNQLRTSSNLRNQATIQDTRVTMQQVQERQGQSYVGTSYKGNATSSWGNNAGGQAKVVKCYNCQSEGHMARQCTQPKRPRNAVWFKEKAILSEAQEFNQILDEEQLAFHADPGIPVGQAAQTTIPNTAAFQTEDLDAYDSDCDDVSNAKAILMDNLSNYGKIKKSSHQPKVEDTNQEKLHLLHMDLCGMMRVESVNGKKYILVIIDDYSLFTWVKFLKSKDEAPDAIIKCIKNIQVRLNATVRNVRTYNGTEFVNQTLHEFYENVGISHQTSVARTPQQNGIVERRNRTLVEAARAMLIFSKAPLFLWTEEINTTCYTQNRSLIRLRYNKTPYELMHDKKPDLSFLYVIGSLCYPTNDSEDLGKLNAKADSGICVGCTLANKAFRIYNRRTWKIMETIHVTFDELTTMASEQFSSGPGL